MTTSIKAVFEKGLFRPTVDVALTEGTHVEVLIPAIAAGPDAKTVALRLIELSGKSLSTNVQESTSEQTDEILYGRKPQP